MLFCGLLGTARFSPLICSHLSLWGSSTTNFSWTRRSKNRPDAPITSSFEGGKSGKGQSRKGSAITITNYPGNFKKNEGSMVGQGPVIPIRDAMGSIFGYFLLLL